MDVVADETDHRASRPQSGRWWVLVMFAFAGSATGLLYLYWNLHTGPFRPLTEALAREFEDSHPLVQGGQEKMHKGTPRVLRITLRVDFDPNAKETAERADETVHRIIRLAESHHGLAKYESLEIHLVHLRPEQEPQLREVRRDVKDILTLRLLLPVGGA